MIAPKTSSHKAGPSLVAWWLGDAVDPPPWLARFQPFLTKLGAGNAVSGAWLAAILIATALVYSRSLGGEFILDDRWQIARNQFIGTWSFIWKSLCNDAWWFYPPSVVSSPQYRPMHDVWLALNFHLFGFHPAGWHAASIALHLLVVWLGFRVALLLSADRTVALLAMALFALMPIHVTAVVWSAAVATPLSAAFELGAFELYLRRGASPPSDCRRRRWRAVSLGLFGGALLTYEAAVTFPALVAAYAFLREPHRTYGTDKSDGPGSSDGWRIAGARRAIAAAWPYGLGLIPYFALRAWALRGETSLAGSPSVHLMKVPELLRWLPLGIATYLRLMLIPWQVRFKHVLKLVPSVAAPEFYWPAAGIAALPAAFFLLLRRHPFDSAQGRPHRHLYLFCAAWFLIALSPLLLSPLLTPANIEERYLYLPSFGFCLMVADIAVLFARGSAASNKAVRVGAVAVLLVYAIVLFHLQRYLHDEAALAARAVEEYPQDAEAHSELGNILESQGDWAGARHQFETAAALDPNAGAYLFQRLAHVDERLGDRPAAARALNDWIKRVEHPSLDNYIEVALADDAAGDTKRAEAALAYAAALPGGSATAMLTRAQIRFRHGDPQGAEAVLRALLRNQPNNRDALLDLGMVLAAERRYGEAVAIYRRAASGLSNAPLIHYRIALLLHLMGRDREAHDECAIVLKEAPGDPKPRALMAALGGGK